MPLINRHQILKRLEEHRIPHFEIRLQNDVTIVLSELGGRIYGPFLTPQSDSLSWVPAVFSDQEAFSAHLPGGWNYGGERFWIAPEIQYLVRDRDDYFGSLFIPPSMDPGSWQIDRSDDSRWQLSQSLELEAFNLASGRKTLHIDVTLYPSPNPLRHLAANHELMEDVVYAGYNQIVRLREEQHDEILSAAWNLFMLNPGGEILIPCTPAVEVTCYKGDLDERVMSVRRNHVRFQISGKQMYKAGLKAAHTFGRLAYLHPRTDGPSYLLVRNFSNNPAAEYPEEPPHLPGLRGDSIHIYNDDGGFGDMGELECNGQTIGGCTGRSESLDMLSLWLFAGPVDRLHAIAFQLLGVE